MTGCGPGQLGSKMARTGTRSRALLGLAQDSLGGDLGHGLREMVKYVKERTVRRRANNNIGSGIRHQLDHGPNQLELVGIRRLVESGSQLHLCLLFIQQTILDQAINLGWGLSRRINRFASSRSSNQVGNDATLTGIEKTKNMRREKSRKRQGTSNSCDDRSRVGRNIGGPRTSTRTITCISIACGAHTLNASNMENKQP